MVATPRLQRTRPATVRRMNEFQDAFRMFDHDGDGAITPTEMTSVFKQLGLDAHEEEIRDLVNDIDADGNGRIDFAEFVTLMTRGGASSVTLEEELFAAFQVFDRDKNGTIDADEIRALLGVLGESVNDDDLRAMIAEVDADNDGRINYVEFVAMMCR